MKRLLKPALGLVLLAPILTAHALSSGDQTETCAEEKVIYYNNGYAAGDAAGYSRGYGVGFGAGTASGIAQCVADPASCGITLASCLPDATYGETEPNDNLVAADPLVLGVKFWGQNRSTSDQDWYYVTSTSANQSLILTFSVPDWIANADLTAGTPAIWNVTVRDSAGNVYAEYTTNIPGAVEGEKYAETYTVTLGLIGTYYIAVKPVVDSSKSNAYYAYSYGVTAFLQDSALTTSQPIVNFGDTEVEPNNIPSKSNPLVTSVTMNGVINLTFNNVVTDGTEEVWAQGEDDWFVYYSTGNETITLDFCTRETCGTGYWFVEVFDQASAKALEGGTAETDLVPLLAFNTSSASTDPQSFSFGVSDPGYYYVRVNLKRLFTAICNEYRYVDTSGKFISGSSGICSCDSDDATNSNSTGSSCYIPLDACSASKTTLSCKRSSTDCTIGSDPGCIYNTSSPVGCSTNATDIAAGATECDTMQLQAKCSCSIYGGVVVVADDAYTSPYNFTLFGTKMPTNTYNTDAYQDFLNRPTTY